MLNEHVDYLLFDSVKINNNGNKRISTVVTFNAFLKFLFTR